MGREELLRKKTGVSLLYGHLPQGGCREIRLARISGLPLIMTVVNDIHRLWRVSLG